MVDGEVQLIVVDAANVVGSRPDGWWRDRAGAARRLLGKVAKLSAQLDEPSEIVVILEGAARAAVDGDDGERAEPRVVLAKGSGDDTIVDVVAEAVAADSNRRITVVTADRGLRDRVEAHGATTVGPRWLLDRVG